MANVAHSSLTGADLHESKGVATAAANTVYVANGLGSGTWTDANTVISSSAWSTGDAKLTLQSSAPTGWILVNDGTLGDGSSGATTRANADTAALFTLLWNLPISLTVSGGRGANAASDYAAHKTIQCPLMLGRVLGVAGSGAGLTSRAIGASTGTETSLMLRSDLPNVAPTFTGNSGAVTVDSTVGFPRSNPGAWSAGGGSNSGVTDPNTNTVHSTGTFTPTGTVQSLNGNVTQTAMTNMQPSSFINLLIKL